MNTKKPATVEATRTVLPDPPFLQKYSPAVRERIAQKAYQLYEQRGRQQGREEEDWLQAETHVREEMTDTRARTT
jgi:hypothetical protein